MLLKETKEDLNKYSDMSCSWFRKLNIVSIHSPQNDLKNIVAIFWWKLTVFFFFFFSVFKNAEELEYPK